MSEINIISPLLEMENQYRIFHWQTKSYAQHQAFGFIYDALSGNIDKFVEVYFGKYGRLITEDEFEIELTNLKDRDVVVYTEECIEYLTDELPTYLNEDKDTDLLNIRDEMLADLNKLKYLLTLG